MSRTRFSGTIACLIVGVFGLFVPALVVAALLIAVLIVVIGSEYVPAVRRRDRGEPGLLESLESPVARQRHDT